MKAIFGIILAVAFFAIGCQDNSSFLAPETSSVNSLEKNNKNNTDSSVSVSDVKTKSKFSKTYKIDGDNGGNVFVEYKWKDKSRSKKKSVLRADLEIPAGAYNGTIEFELIFDLDNYTLELYPSPFSFNKPVILDLKFQNVLINEGDGEFIFNYLDGEFEEMVYDYFNVNEETGTFEVRGAELHHFSRYGLVRRR